MSKINAKNLSKLTFLAVFILGVLLLSGAMCARRPSITAPRPVIEKKTGLSCDVGSRIKIAGAEYKVTGIERHTIGGKTMDTCCQELTREKEKTKLCNDVSGDYSITWQTDEKTGKFFKASETFKQDDQTCVKIFDQDENVTSEMCF